MRDITTSSGSQIGQVQLEIILSSTETVPFVGGSISLIHSSLSHPTIGYAVYKHYLNAPSFDYVDKLLQTAMVDGTPVMRCRIGIGSGEKLDWLPWQVHTITSYKAVPLGFGAATGHMVEITSCDVLWVMDKVNRVAPHKGKLSDIAKAIIDQYDHESVIEETNYEGFYIQSFQSDLDFLRNRVMHRAKSMRGVGNYQLFVKDGIVHFHPPDYRTDLKAMRYFKGPGTDLLKRDQGQTMLDKGVAGVRFVSYSPFGGQFKEIVTDRNKTLKFGNVIPDIERFQGAEINFPHHVTLNPETEIQALADNFYEDARLNTYEVELTIPNTLQLRHGDILFLDISPSQERTSDWSGYYYVTRTTTAYLRGSISMRTVLRRGELNANHSDQTALSAVADNVITPPRTAPGIGLNVQAIEASQVTKDREGVTPGGVVVTAKDPQTA